MEISREQLELIHDALNNAHGHCYTTDLATGYMRLHQRVRPSKLTTQLDDVLRLVNDLMETDDGESGNQEADG